VTVAMSLDRFSVLFWWYRLVLSCLWHNSSACWN